MPYANIVFVKLEKRLLNDPRWWTMSESAQLTYIKLILLAAETYNKIPLNDNVLREAIRSRLLLEDFQKCLEEIKANFPKFQKNKHVRYFLEFNTKTNYVSNKGTPKDFPSKTKGTPKGVTEEEQEEDKEKNKKKRQLYLSQDNIKSLKKLYGSDESLKRHLLNMKFTEHEIIEALTRK